MGFKPEDAIVPGASLLSDGANMWFQSAQNKRNRQFTREMYWRQREDALSDWHMQNAYNAPLAQMERLKAAGLNPNLVYGNGAEAMSGGMPRASSSSGGQGEAPRVNLQNAAMSYYDTQLKQVAMDQTQQNMELMKLKMITEGERAKNVAADTMKKIQDTRTGSEALAWAMSQRPVMAAITHAQLDKLSANIQFTLDENERKTAMNAANLRIAAEQILNMRLSRAKTRAEIDHIKQQIQNLKTSQGLQDLEQQWMKEGKTKGDWYFWRFLNDAVGGNPGKETNRLLNEKLLQGWGNPE